MTDIKKIGVIGCSRVFEKYFLPAIKSTDKAKITYIGSRSEDKAKQFAKLSKCNQFGSYEDVINSNVDSVYISLPVGLHEKYVLKAAAAGKHILCEKSSTTSYSSAIEMVSTCKQNKVRILETFAFRFHPQHKLVEQKIIDGEIGEISNFNGFFGFPVPPSNDFRLNLKLGGGVLNDAGCYPICASRMLFKKEPISVHSKAKIDNKRKIDLKINSMLEYDKNRIAFISAAFGNYFQSTYNLWGTKSMISTERAYAIARDKKTKILLYKDNKIKEIIIPHADQTKIMIEEFCNEISNKTKNTFSFEEDLLSQAKTMEAIRVSFINDQPVFLRDMKN